MSEPNEAVSEDTTEREEEQPGCNAVIVPQSENELTENQHEDQLGNETTMAMLEDEEMPTFVTVSTPSRQQSSSSTDGGQQESESRADNRSSNSCHSDEQGEHSVCVISSGEESDHPPSDEEDDPEEDYDESDADMEDVDMEDDIEEEEEEDEEDTDGDIGLESYKRSCDDMILTYNNGMRGHQIGRSCSLQDISFTNEHSEERFHKKRYSMDTLIEDERFLRNPVLRSINEEPRRSVPGSMKYRNVESKVKLYIQGIKMQNRQSHERRLERKNQNNNPPPNVEGPMAKPIDNRNTPTINIKDYAERVVKDLEREELKGNTMYNHNQIIENGEEILNVKTINMKNVDDAKIMDIDHEPMENQKNLINCEAKTEKRNGTVENNTQSHTNNLHMENRVILNEQNVACFFNGQADVPALFNLRTMTYEEYMSVANSNEKPEMNMEVVDPEEYVESVYSGNNMEEQETVNDDDEPPCALKIECVKTIRMNTPEMKENQNESNFAEMPEQSAKIIDQENSNVSLLQMQLRQKSLQFDEMQDLYEKTLAEKYELKRQLEEFKKVVLMYQKENERPEMKAVAVQTDILVNPISNSEANETRHLGIKLSTSSIGSTVSSNDPWADYSHSPAISLRPPSLTGILTSDESSVGMEKTPRKTVRPLSRAFITSSRILQTLSSITQRRFKPDSPLANNVRNDVHDVLKDTSKKASGLAQATYASSTPHPSSKSKKRKATEMLGTSSVVQPSKIAYTESESRRSLSSVSEMDGEFKRPGDYQSTNTRTNLGVTPECTNSEPSEETAENSDKSNKNNDDNEDDGNENGVKCIMYQEDENSKDRSFLIQAEENDKAGNAKGFVRECGPYLLGNVEVRMSEINGTINIWGKELSEDTLHDNEEEEENEGDEIEEVEVSKKSNDTRPCTCSHKAPRAHFLNHSHLVCSTNKKPKVPARFGEPSCSRNTRSPLIGTDAEEHRHTTCSFGTNEARSNCENSDLENRLLWSNNKRVPTSRHNRSHCSHSPEFINADADCMHVRERLDNDRLPCRRHSCNVQEEHRCSSLSDHNTSHHWKHSCSTRNHSSDPVIENICRHQTTCHRGVIHSGEEKDCQHDAKQYNSHENTDHRRSTENPCHYKCHESDETPLHSPNSGDDDEEDPLLSKRSNETSESRRRRLSGKRVRGILMDFFKGCGDCRSPSTSNSNKTNCNQRESYKPQIRITPCTPPQSMSFEMKQPQQKTNRSTSNRHCQSCNRRIEMTTEIESQLECFRVEMERLRSRSDAVLDMLNVLYSTDLN